MRRFPYLHASLRHLVATAASGGIVAQALLGAALSLPMLMVATPAQAAGQCTSASLPLVALYSANAAALNQVFLGDFGSVYCSGFPANTTLYGCLANGTSSTYGTNYLQAKSANGNVLNYRLTRSGPTYFSDGMYIWGVGTNSYGVNTFWNDRVNIDVPQQNVPPGDYRGQYAITVNVSTGGCSSSPQATYTLLLPVTIRVGGSCLLGWSTSVDLGTITPDQNGNINQNNGFTSIGSACSVGQSYKLTLSGGNSPSGSGNYTWHLRSGQSSIAYGFFQDDGNTPVTSSGITYPGTGGASSVDAGGGGYGSHNTFTAIIGPNQPISAIEPGVYTDNVMVTMSW